MNKLVFVFLFLSFMQQKLVGQTFTNLNAGVKADTVIAPKGGLGEMTFEKTEHNFDTLEYEGNGTYEFKFKNTGTEPVIISDAKGSCGCTVPTFPKNTPIKPGESEVIKVTYDTKRWGRFTKTVTIFSNAKEPVKTITIKGYVRPKPVETAFPANGTKSGGMVPFEK